ncbi:hypothetical protein D3C78_1591800 [compost metagenome]
MVKIRLERREICIVKTQRQVAAVALVPAFQPGVGGGFNHALDEPGVGDGLHSFSFLQRGGWRCAYPAYKI